MEIFVDSNETTIIFEGVRYLRIEGSFYFGIGILFLLYGYYRYSVCRNVSCTYGNLFGNKSVTFLSVSTTYTIRRICHLVVYPDWLDAGGYSGGNLL